MCVTFVAPDSKLDVLDLGRLPFRASLRGVRRAMGCRHPKSANQRTRGGGDDDGVGGHGAAGDTDRIERVYLDGDEAYGFTHDYNGSHLLS